MALRRRPGDLNPNGRGGAAATMGGPARGSSCWIFCPKEGAAPEGDGEAVAQGRDGEGEETGGRAGGGEGEDGRRVGWGAVEGNEPIQRTGLYPQFIAHNTSNGFSP